MLRLCIHYAGDVKQLHRVDHPVPAGQRAAALRGRLDRVTRARAPSDVRCAEQKYRRQK